MTPSTSTAAAALAEPINNIEFLVIKTAHLFNTVMKTMILTHVCISQPQQELLISKRQSGESNEVVSTKIKIFHNLIILVSNYICQAKA